MPAERWRSQAALLHFHQPKKKATDSDAARNEQRAAEEANKRDRHKMTENNSFRSRRPLQVNPLSTVSAEPEAFIQLVNNHVTFSRHFHFFEKKAFHSNPLEIRPRSFTGFFKENGGINELSSGRRKGRRERRLQNSADEIRHKQTPTDESCYLAATERDGRR